MMGFCSYPRTAAELAAVLSLGIDEVMRLLRAGKLRVNLRRFLKFLFQERQYQEAELDRFNQKVLHWQQQQAIKGLNSSALVYHHSGAHKLHGFSLEKISYEKKVDRSLYDKERREFGQLCKNWLKSIAISHAEELKAAGLSESQINRMQEQGKVPKGYQVHHRIPLDDGGKNEPANYILIRDNFEHRAVHGYYNPAELRIRQLAPGQAAEVALPVPPKDAIIYPNPACGYVAEKVAHVELFKVYADEN